MSEEQQPIVRWDKPAFNLSSSCRKGSGRATKSNTRVSQATRKYPPDKYKKNNPGNYRAFEICGYRIAYCLTDREIIILRFKGIKQKPEFY